MLVPFSGNQNRDDLSPATLESTEYAEDSSFALAALPPEQKRLPAKNHSEGFAGRALPRQAKQF
jgi:hypothetical protein